MAQRDEFPHIGWREWIALPALGVARIKAKIDTGARTGSLHAVDLENFERDGVPWVRFLVRPEQSAESVEIAVEHEVTEFRLVRSSNGQQSLRPVILTQVKLGQHVWTTEVTLADRDAMGFKMLLGRHSIRGQFVVDPGRSFLGSRFKKRSRSNDSRSKKTD